jgi:hypothetical protein
MVHALENIRNLLKPGGRLLDIHPLEDPRPIEVHISAECILAGWLRESDDYIEYVQADEAIAHVIGRRLYALERRDTFTHKIHAETIWALRDYLAETSQDSIIDDLVLARADELMRTVTEDKEVVMRIPVQMSLLRPCSG